MSHMWPAIGRLARGFARSTAAVALAACLLSVAGQAEALRQLTWEDLVPPGPELIDPLAELPTDPRYELGFIANLRHMVEQGQVPKGNPAITEAAELTVKLQRQGIDVEGYIARFEAFRQAIEAQDQALNEDLDGQRVRIPGYLLPLEFDGAGVSEFLLVPYVGACIHAPPPPPNQIVHVRLEGSYATSELYTPVWVAGLLRAERSSRALSLVDGQAQIAVGYAMPDAEVTPYEN